MRGGRAEVRKSERMQGMQTRSRKSTVKDVVHTLPKPPVKTKKSHKPRTTTTPTTTAPTNQSVSKFKYNQKNVTRAVRATKVRRPCRVIPNPRWTPLLALSEQPKFPRNTGNRFTI